MELAERETIINWNDKEDTINVFTCHKRIMTKMEKLGAKVKDRCMIGGRVQHIEYEIPKDKINVILSAKRTIRIDEKERQRDRGRVLAMSNKNPLKKHDRRA